jgi:hypothetical protein
MVTEDDTPEDGPSEKNALGLAFADFLQSVPPGSEKVVEELVNVAPAGNNRLIWRINTPDVLLYCGSDQCGGLRTYRSEGLPPMIAPQNEAGPNDAFLNYVCSNCRKSFKTFALRVLKSDEEWRVNKFGEAPAFGRRRRQGC